MAFQDCLAQPVPGVALDIGASPGGWTSFLSDRPGWQVVACDPGELDQAVVGRSNVTHLRCMVQTVDWSALPGLGSTPFRLIVCDMNGLDCRDEMRLMLSLLPLMQPEGGLLVVTLKLPQKCSPAQAEKLSLESTAILHESGRCEVSDSIWLLANRNNERTLVVSVGPAH